MSSFFQMIEVLAVCGVVLLLTLMVLVNLPQSPLRALLIQIFGWTFAAFCGVYVLSPMDVLPEAIMGPFGIPDDIGEVVAGVISVKAALRAGADREDVVGGIAAAKGLRKVRAT